MESYGKVMADLCRTILTYFWQKNNSEIDDFFGQVSKSLVWNISLGTFSEHFRIWCNSCNSCKNTPKQLRGF